MYLQFMSLYRIGKGMEFIKCYLFSLLQSFLLIFIKMSTCFQRVLSIQAYAPSIVKKLKRLLMTAQR